MLYKTIVMEILQDRPELRQRLSQQRMLLPTLERLAQELKASHETWKKQLASAKPQRDPIQIASEAMELAVEGLMRALPSEERQNPGEPLSLDGAMAFIQQHSNPA
jgi:hypothetical protein